jgi:hypothetical protein
MVIEDSPHPNVVLSRFDRGKFPSFLPGWEPDLDRFFVAMENTSDLDISGLSAVWVTVDPQGKPRKLASRWDNFLNSGSGPVVRAGTRVLLAPGLFLSEGGGFGSPNLRLIEQFADQVQQSTGARMVIDAVVFSDGTLAGPDVLHYADDIAARPWAARDVAAPARDAMSRGLPVSEAVSPFMAKHLRPADGKAGRRARWAGTFARQLTAAPDPGAYLRYLEAIPIALVIRRATND